MTQATQPKVEWGFYAITPRIVRTQYKNLSHAEKWLYVCLKDLCGEKGMCYRTLRSLSEETNISIASLSSMIPSLQKAGLIHAEKKKRSNSGKEIWHISIVDIWQANHEYCSKIEQSEQVVQNLNNDVQNLNEVSQDCSENERVCSDFPYRRITPEEETITEERTVEEREVATATARSQSPGKFSDAGFYSPIPMTYNEALAYLVPHGPHEGLDAVQVVKLAQKLWTEAHEDDEDTVEREAVKPSQKDVAQNGHADEHPVVDHHSPVGIHQSQPSQPEHRKDTNKNTEPPHPRKPPTNPVPRRPKQQGLMDEIPSLPASKPVEPVADMAWGTRKCLQWFDYWRGGTLIAKYKLQQAASFAKGLAEQFDEKTVVEIYGDMAKDPYYIERGGPDIGDVVNNIHKYINKKKPKKEPSNEHKASSFYTLDAFIERQNQWKTEGVTS